MTWMDGALAIKLEIRIEHYIFSFNDPSVLM